MSKPQLKGLYKNLGGEERLGEILRDFYQRMSRDLLIGFFFSNQDIHSIAERQKQFLLFAMGASSSYTGKAPGFAHLGLPPILKGHFDRRLVILEETLRDYDLCEKDIRTWVRFENAFRSVIVK